MTAEPVPEKLRNPINYKVIGLILGIGVGIYLLTQYLSEVDTANFLSVVSVVFASGVSVSSFIVAKRYWRTSIFGKSYLALGLGYLSYAIAEILYYSFDIILGIEPYPSIADVFFFGVYPLAIVHLILNIRFFNVNLKPSSKIWMPAIPIVFLIIYGYFSYAELQETNFDFYYGMIFVAASSVTLSFVILGASIFRQGVISTVWFLLLIGLLINALGDLWYYHLEIFGGYSDTHPLNPIWYVSNFIMIYALYKHQKIL